MTGSSDFLVSRELLTFFLFEWLRAENEADRETFTAMLDTAHQLAHDKFVPCYRKGDIQEPAFDGEAVRILPEIRDALHSYAELGLFGVSFPEDLGGLGLSMPVSLAIFAMFASANISISAYSMLTAGNARLLSAFGAPKQIDQFARPQIEGHWFGTMCLSEPQAGSSLADIRARAVKIGSDDLGTRYRIVGNKMWISAGDHDASDNIVHLVLAKCVQDDGDVGAGTKGISLFIVPKFLPDGSRNDVSVAGLNHKMGFRGTSNCLLNFGERGGAVGWLVGKEGQGLAQMFMMMNEARINVGMGAAALAYRGYRQSLNYACERVQGRPIGVASQMPVRLIDHPDVRRMLLQQKAYAEGALALCLYCGGLARQGDDPSEELLALLTPVAKTWPSEFGLAANDLAIQIHGGYGYTRDFDVEQIWRDNRLNPIHEGTTGIQAIDLLRRKIVLSDGKAVEILRQRIAATVERARCVPDWEVAARQLEAFWRTLSELVVAMRGSETPALYDDATLFLRAFGHGVVAWLWLDVAMAAAAGGDPAITDGTAHSCRFFFQAELPQALSWLGIVAGQSELMRSMPEHAF